MQQPDGTLEIALSRSMDETLGPSAGRLRAEMCAEQYRFRTVMPAAENIVLWLSKNLPAQVGEIVERAKLHYQHGRPN